MRIAALAVALVLLTLGAVAGASTAIALLEHRISQLEEIE